MFRFISAFVLALQFSVGTAYATGKKIEVTVKGMTCEHCSETVTKKFTPEAAVAKCEVNVAKQLVTLSLREGQDLPDQKIKDLLEDTGYPAVKITRK